MLGILKKIDWKLQGAVFVLMITGLISLLSSRSDLFYKQLLWIGIGLILGVCIALIDIRSFLSHGGVTKIVYGITLFFLVIVLFFAPVIKGNRAWLMLGSFQFQPSELAKLAIIFFLSSFFTKQHIGIGRWSTIITSFCIVAIPAALVVLQPDMGSALILFSIWFGFVLVSGIPWKRLLVVFLIGVAIVGSAWAFVLKDYQKERVMGLFQNQRDPLGANYNVIQSKIAIGSGGLFGKGFGQGTQVQLGFLPEAQTDFIFSAIAEEGGFLAIVILLGAYGMLLTRILSVGVLIEGNMGKFLCLGAVVLFVVQLIFNVGSTVGFMPVVGVTLPFVSYGGSSMMINLMLIGVIQSLYIRK